MIKNYFKVALRNLLRQKSYSVINVTGLAVGIASCLILFIIVVYEKSYDKFQPSYNQIYRVVTQDKHADGLSYTPGTPFPLLDALRTGFPQVKIAALDAGGSQVTILNNQTADNSSNKKFIEDAGMYFMEPEMFSVFHYTFLSGDATVLKDPNNAILTKLIADKYFGDWHQAVGKLIKLDNAITLKVAAIIDDPPANTDLPMRMLVSFETLKKNASLYNYSKEWGSTSSNSQLYVLLPTNITAASFNKLLENFSNKQYKGKRSKRIHYLQPLSEIHFDTRFGNLGDHVTSKATINTLILVGLLIIVMACINFINLSTAQAIGRSKEVGVRKVLGGSRPQLFWQMMGETAIVVLVSVLIAIMIAKLALPFIKHIASVQEALPVFNSINIIFLLAIAFIVTVFSGSYPSLILSGFTPALALKNKITSASIGGISLRRGLVVLQFAISQILIIGTIIAISQMNFVKHADLGFNKDAVIILTGNNDSISIAKFPAFKQELLQLPGVQSVSFSTDAPSSDNNWGTNFSFDNGKDLDYTLFLKYGDEDYLKTYGLQLAAGRNLSKSDTVKEVLINETLAHKLGFQNANDIVGKNLRPGGGPLKPIVGVLKDFKTNSLRDAVKPLMFSTMTQLYGNTAIKMHSNNILATKNDIEKTWNKYFPDYAFSSNFFDENIARFYQQEEQLSLLYKIFAGLAVFISCLGLYGLVSFMAVQRVKEVGIRKVLGASVANILYLFSKEFTILITIAFLIAMPVAYYMMTSWLSNFAYRVPMNAGVFLLAVIISIVIAWITVGYKAIRAALANPVKSLRSE